MSVSWFKFTKKKYKKFYEKSLLSKRKKIKPMQQIPKMNLSGTY